MRIKIDTSAVVKFQGTLKQLHKSALPIAVRQTLNSVAFDVKQVTMPASAADAFVQRNKTFFKANSKVEQAKGFDLKSMQSIAGFKPTGKANQAVKELTQQEHGGKIDRRALISMKQARAGGNWKKNVKANNRLAAIKGGKFINAEKGTGSQKQKFVRAAYKAVSRYGENAYVLGTKWGGRKQVLYRIEEIWGSTRRTGLRGSRKLWIKKVPLYTYQKNRKIDVKGTRFMREASIHSAGKATMFFIQAAEKQIQKYL